MSLSGHWELEETTGSSLTDSSGNSINGTTNGTPSGTQGVLLTSIQTIQLPYSFENNESISIGFFVTLSFIGTQQTLFSTYSSVGDNSVVIHIDSNGYLVATHNSPTAYSISSISPISASVETHVSYCYDYETSTQYIFINGVLESSSNSIGQITYNSNSITMGSTFVGYIRDVYIYSSNIGPAGVEGLAKNLDSSFILPFGTVYGSKVSRSADVTSREPVFQNQYRVIESDGSHTAKSSHGNFIYNSTNDTTEESTRVLMSTDSLQKTGAVSFKLRDDLSMVCALEFQPSLTTIQASGISTFFTPEGLKTNADESALYFGASQTFRIKLETGIPNRLLIQYYDSSSNEYKTKTSIVNYS